MKKSEKRTKVYLLDRTKIADPVSFSSWKDFLPKERWEKTVRPVREEDRKTELAAWLLLYHALKEWESRKKVFMQMGHIVMESMANRNERRKKSVLIFHIPESMLCV